MNLFHFSFLALLAVSATAIIDCSLEDTCFGDPFDCNPNTECTSLFHFDIDGNLHLYLRDFNDSFGYAAFAVNRHPKEVIEYFICLPHQGKCLRGLAELGGIVDFAEQNTTGVVESLDINYFRCTFDVSELPERFQQEQMFFVSKGTFDETLVIYDGAQLYNLEREVNSDEDFGEDEVFPTLEMEKLASSQRRLRSRSVHTRRRKQEAVDDIEEEEKLRSRTKTKARGYEDVEDVEEEEQEDSRPRRRQNTKTKIGPPLYDEDDEDDIEDDEDKENHHSRARINKHKTRFHDGNDDSEDMEDNKSDEVPKRSSNKKRRHNDRDEGKIGELRRKNTNDRENKKSIHDEDEYENEDDNKFFDYLENSGDRNYKIPTVCHVILLLAALPPIR